MRVRKNGRPVTFKLLFLLTPNFSVEVIRGSD